MVFANAVQQRQMVWIEHPRFGAEVAQDALGLQGQLAAVGLRPQRAVQQEDARRRLARVCTECVMARAGKQVGGQMGEVEERG